MQLNKQYIFKSERLGFRNWMDTDLPLMAKINIDPNVMEFFPKTYNKKETKAFIDRMKKQFSNKGFCYFAVDKLCDNNFIGFIGLSEQTYKSNFTPCIDIGWRLSSKEWHLGYASEGAKRCLEYAFKNLKINNIKAVCPLVNKKSERVMEKIGMIKKQTFIHPALENNYKLKNCVLYKIERY